MLQFSAIGLLAVVALAMCWSLAIVVYRVSAAGSVGRQLSLLLVVEGATLISTGYLDLFLSEAARAASWYPAFYRFEEIVHTVGDCLMLALYPPFLAAALRTRLTEPFGTRRARIVLLLLAAVLCMIVLFGSLKIGGTFLYISLVVLFVFALVASIDAWRSAEGIARSRAGTFAVAFGARDVCWSFVYGWATLVLWQGTYAIVDPSAPTVPFLVYALGKAQRVLGGIDCAGGPLAAHGAVRVCRDGYVAAGVELIEAGEDIDYDGVAGAYELSDAGDPTVVTYEWSRYDETGDIVAPLGSITIGP